MADVVLVLLAAFAEVINSSLGMMYGTLLSPLLIALGNDPLVLIPALLFSQAVSGLIAATKHHLQGNVNFRWDSDDFKSFLLIVFPGIIAVVVGAYVAIEIPNWLLKAYIGLLVVAIGIIVLMNVKLKFSFKRIALIGFISAFNKALSGGGFGPLVTSGQIAIGQKSKNAISITTLAEAPICMGSFIAYYFLGGFTDWYLLFLLTLGATFGAFIGPRITSSLNHKKIRTAVAVLAIVAGVWILHGLF